MPSAIEGGRERLEEGRGGSSLFVVAVVIVTIVVVVVAVAVANFRLSALASSVADDVTGLPLLASEGSVIDRGV